MIILDDVLAMTYDASRFNITYPSMEEYMPSPHMLREHKKYSTCLQSEKDIG